MLLQHMQSHRHTCCFSTLPSSCSPASWRATGSTWPDLQQANKHPWVCHPKPSIRSDCICLAWSPEGSWLGTQVPYEQGTGFPPRAGAVWRGVCRGRFGASSAADSQTKFFSLALGWKCLKTLSRQTVVLAESKCQPCLCRCPCAGWANNPSADCDSISLWEKDCITDRQQLLNCSFPQCTHDPLSRVLL